MVVKKCIRTLKKIIRKDVRVTFIVTFNTTKLHFYTNTKCCISKIAYSYIVYKFCCPGCSKSYIVKENISIIDRGRLCEILLFKEALQITEKNPTLNNGLKASKELKLF